MAQLAVNARRQDVRCVNHTQGRRAGVPGTGVICLVNARPSGEDAEAILRDRAMSPHFSHKAGAVSRPALHHVSHVDTLVQAYLRDTRGVEDGGPEDWHHHCLHLRGGEGHRLYEAFHQEVVVVRQLLQREAEHIPECGAVEPDRPVRYRIYPPFR